MLDIPLMAAARIRFAHISDTHIISPEEEKAMQGEALASTQKCVEDLNKRSFALDFVVHTGDICNDRDPKACKLAAQTLSKLSYPLYPVSGNHDSGRDIREYFALNRVEVIDPDPTRLAYAFQLKGYRFVVLDAVGPKEMGPHGELPSVQLNYLNTELRASIEPVVVFIHFPPIELDCEWVKRDMLLLNGEEVHEAFKALGSKLRGVFFGHIHRSLQTVKDGVLYVGAAALSVQFNLYPEEHEASRDVQALPGFNTVSLLDDGQVLIRNFQLPSQSCGLV